MSERKGHLFLHTSVLKGNISLCLSYVSVAFWKISGGVTYTNVDTGKTVTALSKRKYPPPWTREMEVQWLMILFCFPSAFAVGQPWYLCHHKSCGWSSMALQRAHCNHVFPLNKWLPAPVWLMPLGMSGHCLPCNLLEAGFPKGTSSRHLILMVF